MQKKYVKMLCRGKLLSTDKPLIMGILNITPNSFFDGGQYQQKDAILKRVEQILKEGADIVDIGCMATNPQAKELSEIEELKIVEKVGNLLFPRYKDIVFSIDTYRSKVAEMAVNMGVAIINDISGGDFDAEMFDMVAKLHVPYILMHTSGKPQEMQQKTDYQNLIKDIMLIFSKKIQVLRQLGVCDIIIDPGFGFGKTIEQNYELMKNLSIFQTLQCPILIGISRKSMIYQLLETAPADALGGTIVLNTFALLKGANILRVHDVRQAVETVKILSQLL